MKKEPIALLTSCTVTRNYDSIVKIADAPKFDHMQELCDWWATQMGKVPPNDRRTPGELYAGLSFTAITEMAQAVGHDNIFIVTGGIGLGRYTDKFAPYDFTADKKAPHNAHQHVTGEKFLPHVWWSKINQELHENPHPVSALLESHDLIVGALPKMFIKYIVADLAACSVEDRRERIFIPIPRSMLGSMPTGVRDAFVPYGADYTADVVFTRTDKAQRVVQKFLSASATDDSMLDHAQAVSTTISDVAPREATDYAQMFKDHPELLEAEDIGTALYRVKLLGLKSGGKTRFAGAWRNAKGPQKFVGTKTELSQSAKAFKSMLSTIKPMKVSNEDVILLRVGLFLETLKEVDASLIFSAREIVQWGAEMYPEVPDGIDNTNKVAYTLMYNTEYLGLEMLDADGKKVFRVKQE